MGETFCGEKKEGLCKKTNRKGSGSREEAVPGSIKGNLLTFARKGLSGKMRSKERGLHRGEIKADKGKNPPSRKKRVLTSGERRQAASSRAAPLAIRKGQLREEQVGGGGRGDACLRRTGPEDTLNLGAVQGKDMSTGTE